ncbi:Ig-like domain-containing protein [Leifsonia poae]|uniref:Ig-like domain-containing protein n=1 Tax=Leifsonia poae TaxID=110933 RepID=UPI001CBB3B47|nr:Ig-like domain-containing protein [Leifsonia poae]
MPKRMSTARRLAVAIALCLTPAIAVGLAPAAFASPVRSAPTEVATGDDWSVTSAPGGYIVTLRLDEPLPMVNDAPTLLVDGKSIGLAAESDDLLSLSVATSDPAVAKATSVTKGWSSGDTEKAQETDSAPATPTVPENKTLLKQLKSLAAPLAAGVPDPAETGAYTVTEAEYDFGDQAVPLAAIGGLRGEVTGKMYLSSASGARPTIILLHGRHTSCSGGGANPLRWPCGPTQMNIRSYLGYEGTARSLASDGYNVLSIAANSVNSNDNQLALDYGAQARGQLILDTLTMLQKASAGTAVSFDDITTAASGVPSTTTTRTLDEALVRATTRADQPAAASGVTAASLVGRFDLKHVGIMGHSRGGEGVVSAATLNQALDTPFGIEAVLPLAPVDFGRMTLPDVPTAVFLPYCDGDVSNQQGQHFIDDSRNAFDDNVLRSAVWVMGADHNFFNTVWTPGLYPAATGDDWSTSDRTSTCATTDPTRLSAAQQYQVGVSYMTGFFRLTMGGEKQFQPLFDGSVKPTTPLTSFADVRVMAKQPQDATSSIAEFTSESTLIRTVGAATATVCTNLTGRTVPQSLPFCAVTKASAQVPHWTPGSFAPNVPEFPATKFLWTGASATDPAVASTGELRVSVPAKQRDVSAFSQLTVKTAPDETVKAGTDFTITVIDGSGASTSVLASTVNPLAVNRMPGGTHTTLNKIVLQQLTIPTSSLTGIDLKDVREVRFKAANGADGTGTGGVYLSDLAFDTPSVGTAVIATRTTVNVGATSVEEGDGPGTADVPVYLSRADKKTITAYVSVLGSATATAGIAMEKVVFAPGETCKAVTVTTAGNKTPSSTPSTAFKVSATNTQNAVMGANAFANLTVREDDGITGSAVALPPVGVQGDVCAELASVHSPSVLATTADDVAPDDTFTATARGYRVGESVAFTFGAADLGRVIADKDGVASLEITVAPDATLGATPVTAIGAAFGHRSAADISVLAPTETTLSFSPAKPAAGDVVTFVATVTGADTAGKVTLLDSGSAPARTITPALSRAVAASDPIVLGSAELVHGVATVTVALPAGTHSVTARFERTATASSSLSDPLTFSVRASGSVGGGSGAAPTDSAGGSASDPLAATGLDIVQWVVGALIVLAIGAGLVWGGRRRRIA